MKASELRGKAAPELQEELMALLREQFNLRMQQSIGQQFRHSELKRVRRDVARVKTVLNERKGAA